MTRSPGPPEEGVSVVIAGAVGVANAANVNALLRVAVPPSVTTTTSFGPAVPAGVMAVMEVPVERISVAVAPPIVTVASSRPPPVMVMLVPPATDPVAGRTSVNVGAAI